MLTAEQNERLTRVGPGTPMGELMRRYWHPILPSAELSDDSPTKEVRLLGEDMVLYRDRTGRVGMIAPQCAHRKTNLSYGIPEDHGLRCVYHGWVYDETGACVEMPNEPNQRFKEKVCLKAYPCQELGGLVFAYMGPEPVPLVPRWDLLVWDNVTREIKLHQVPCNWLQCHENSLDPVHFEWLHRYYGQWMTNKKSSEEERKEWDTTTVAKGRPHTKIGFDRFEYGVIKRRLVQGETEECDWWRIGHPILFPYTLRVGPDAGPGTNRGWAHEFQIRLPVDDTSTLHITYTCHVPRAGEKAAPQEFVPSRYMPVYDDGGRLIGDNVVSQDIMAWVAQGPIADRTTEALGLRDVGVIMFRNLLEEQMAIVADGGEPMNVHRDPEKNRCIVLPQEESYYPGDTFTGGPFRDLKPQKAEVEAVLDPELLAQGDR